MTPLESLPETCSRPRFDTGASHVSTGQAGGHPGSATGVPVRTPVRPDEGEPFAVTCCAPG
jgi:hypothetical protein